VPATPETDDSWVFDETDQLKPSAARVYDYLLGGAHNFAVDRALADRLLALYPNGAHAARVNRAFMRRAVLFMVEEGIRQFLDLGSGIPTVGNVHEIAQQADPACRVVYVDYEDVAVAHGQLLLEGNDRAAMLQADVAKPEVVLTAPETRTLIDFNEPLGLLAITLFHYLSPAQDPAGMLRRYRDAMAPGSYLAISHAASDLAPTRITEAAEEMRRSSADNVFPRSRAEVLDLFTGFDLVEPGLVTTSGWRPDWSAAPNTNPESDALYAGVGRLKW
jgi:S-adenosyl methyltransferase